LFANFLYFIVVLLIFATYQPADGTNFSPGETAVLFFSLVFFFAAVSRFLFSRIERQIDLENARRLDRSFSAAQQRLLVMAVGIFAVDIYALNLPDFMSGIPLLGNIPTFQAIICVLIFIGYSAIVWAASHTAFRRIYPSPLGRGAYVLSNLSFAVPVLIPWIVLSTLIDIIYALPFDFLQRFLSSPGGELFCILLFLGAVAVTGPALIQKFWRCRPLPKGPIRSRIEIICQKAGVPYRDIVDWPVFGGHMITAGVMGLVKRFRYILVTRALLSSLSPEELDAVIAHEAAHVKKKHLLFYLFFLTGYMLLAYTAFDMIVYLLLYSKPVNLLISAIGYDQTEAAPVLFSIVMVGFFLIYFRYIFGYFMRNFERQADAYAFSMLGTAVPLVTTFKKIAYASGQSPDKPNWHHFSILQRIGFLERCESDRTLVLRHNRKVLRSIIAFLCAMVLLGIVGYQLNFGYAGQRIGSHLLEEILHREIEKSPGDPQLYAVLGDLYYARNDFENTVAAYEHALSINFDRPHVLNNLAWLYATCEDTNYRNPHRALLLAQRAADLGPSPETLDTLGECYYINGEYEKAVEAGIRALELAIRNKSYYEKQLIKFEAALRPLR
jgi:Zn-dependent protease with chaperone function